jgi:hypothetical protein
MGVFTDGYVSIKNLIATLSAKIDAGFALTGDAVVANVLATKTFYKDNYQTKLTGTMPNNGTNSIEITDVDGLLIPEGYYDGTGTAAVSVADQALLIPGNIKDGVTILGVLGTYVGGA